MQSGQRRIFKRQGTFCRLCIIALLRVHSPHVPKRIKVLRANESPRMAEAHCTCHTWSSMFARSPPLTLGRHDRTLQPPRLFLLS